MQTACRAQPQRRDASLHLARIGGRTHPVLEHVIGDRRIAVFRHEQQTRQSRVAQSDATILGARPRNERYFHEGNRPQVGVRHRLVMMNSAHEIPLATGPCASGGELHRHTPTRLIHGWLVHTHGRGNAPFEVHEGKRPVKSTVAAGTVRGCAAAAEHPSRALGVGSKNGVS